MATYHEVKTVQEVDSELECNRLIRAGWILLGVRTWERIHGGEKDSGSVYIMGTTEKLDPPPRLSIQVPPGVFPSSGESSVPPNPSQ